ncbi:hypothetical protein J6590_004732 [Homalodisca vitripennis]|nr:hypothetical protein J6590_004732 [Homalodisca vitripennis]
MCSVQVVSNELLAAVRLSTKLPSCPKQSTLYVTSDKCLSASDMAAFTGPERASCVFWFEESKSATTVQRNFRTKYAKDPPSRPTIYEWHSCFVETGRPSTSDEVVEQVRQCFLNSPANRPGGVHFVSCKYHMYFWKMAYSGCEQGCKVVANLGHLQMNIKEGKWPQVKGSHDKRSVLAEVNSLAFTPCIESASHSDCCPLTAGMAG